MAIPELTNVDVIRGQAANFLVTVPVEADLTVATIEFGIADGPSQPYVITLPTSVNGQVITGQLTGAQCATLLKAKYYYSCWITISGDPTPVARGYITITKDSRNN